MAKILDIGCGFQKRLGAVGIDLLPNSAADVFHDLNVFPWPFPNNEFDMIYATHILEHLDDIIKTMEEIYRIAKPGAKAIIDVPHYTSRGAFTDPTHRNFFGFDTMRYFDPTTNEGELGYTKAKFSIELIFLGRWSGQQKPDWRNPIMALLIILANRVPGWYESYFGYLFPMNNIHYLLRTIK